MGKEKVNPVRIYNKYQITHHAYVDINSLWAGLTNWFSKMEYDFIEQKSKEADKGIGFEIESNWLGTREINDYIIFNIKIAMHFRDLRKVKDDSGRDTHWARVVIVIDTWFDKNFNKTFNSDKWGEFKRQLYERYGLRDELSTYETKLYIESNEIIDIIKSNLY
ncbi:MAG: hypothetical protein Q8Q35_04570 [Nanoarchaeota archaeon]|nr:hypothetical protein [Nanoarchaeota archaeon]